MMRVTTLGLALALGITFTGSIHITQAAADQVAYNFATEKSQIKEQYHRQMVGYPTEERPGTIIINTRKRYLYYVLGNDKAVRYGIGVGRDGFRWKGTERITRKAVWPSWHPPEEMRQRQPNLPESMPGGPKNPLGARALYLGNTLYRIHGTRERWSIGRAMSSGCIRLMNEDVTDLFNRAKVGAKVIVN